MAPQNTPPIGKYGVCFAGVMEGRTDGALVAFCGSETRVRTLGTLANAEFPMSGYRVAKVAGIPESKVYPELRRAAMAGIVRKERGGFRMVDSDLRTLLRKRLRLLSDSDWDRYRSGWAEETPRLLRDGLTAIRLRMKANPSYLHPPNWTRPEAARVWEQELMREPAKDALVRGRGGRTSKREDWNR